MRDPACTCPPLPADAKPGVPYEHEENCPIVVAWAQGRDGIPGPLIVSDELTRLKQATRIRINPSARAALQKVVEKWDGDHWADMEKMRAAGGLRLLLEMYDAVVALE